MMKKRKVRKVFQELFGPKDFSLYHFILKKWSDRELSFSNQESVFLVVLFNSDLVENSKFFFPLFDSAKLSFKKTSWRMIVFLSIAQKYPSNFFHFSNKKII